VVLVVVAVALLLVVAVLLTVEVLIEMSMQMYCILAKGYAADPVHVEK
jgi:hypothetical protein